MYSEQMTCALADCYLEDAAAGATFLNRAAGRALIGPGGNAVLLVLDNAYM